MHIVLAFAIVTMKNSVLFAVFTCVFISAWLVYLSRNSLYTLKFLNNFEANITKTLKTHHSQRSEGSYSKPRMILIYTEFFFSGFPWQGLETSETFTHFKRQKCRVTNCKLTYKKQNFLESNVVIFHAYNMPSSQEMIRLQRRRPSNQVWVYFNLENPIVTSYIAPHKDRSDLDNVFNWTMTFMRESDIYHPYGFYLPLKKGNINSRKQNHASGKTKLAVWTGSGCGDVVDARKVRLMYIRHLRKFIPIDIYGGCAKYFHQPNLKVRDCPRNDSGRPAPQCKSRLQNYKFILAFENMNCVDYITEKYWCTPLELGLVPVVMGGADYKGLAIPGSYINVLDFSSLKELAEYLLYLDKNDEEYNKYFEWKKQYKLGGCLTGQNMANHYPWMCEVCAAANNNSLEGKTYKKIQDFYDPDKRCGIQYSRLKEIITEAFDMTVKNGKRDSSKGELTKDALETAPGSTE